MNLAQHLVRAAMADPDRPAVAHGSRVIHDYRGLAARAARLAGGLRGALGLAVGDRVAIAMANRPEYVESLYAIWIAGLVAAPVNAKLHPREIAWILADSGARLCFASIEIARALREDGGANATRMIETPGPEYQALAAAAPIAVEARDPDDLAWLFYTSGTTGRPKGVMLSHGNLTAAALAYLADVDAVEPGDAILHAAPMSHGSGIYILPHVAGAACNIVPASGGFDPTEICRLLAERGRATMFLAPTMVRRLIDCPALVGDALAGLKLVVYGGGPMYQADLAAARAKLDGKLAQIYGQGESPMTITRLTRRHFADADRPRFAARLASVGAPFAAVDVRVGDEAGRPLPVGAIGEVLVRGACVMRGYWNNPEATASTLRNGWLHTGDLGCLDEEGFLTLKDRSKDMIISGGSNIYPREVEETLLLHPGVAEVSVVGRTNAEWGEEVVAFVVPRPEAAPTSAELDELCLQRIARFKRPRLYRFVDALPKNNYGKVVKNELRALL